MVRPARPDDVPAMQALFRELAEHHGHPGAVEASDADLHAALFGPQPSTFAHVAELDGAVAGVAIWFVTYSTWTGRNGLYLEDLVVAEHARGRGLGRALMDELRRVATERGYRRMDWQVLAGNDRAMTFYRSLGAAPLPEQQSWRLTL